MTLSIKEKYRLRSQYGDWALISGASSGIGLEIASLLAKAGFNLVLISRNADNLLNAKKKILNESDIKIISLALNLSYEKSVSEIIHACKDLNIGLLVLSAGFGTSGLFLDNSIHSELNMLKVNVESVLGLTHYFAQKMTLQGRGGIIFLSSIVAFQGTPFASNYAASKAYIQSFAEGLAVELKPKGIDVLAAAPGPVKSSFGLRANMRMSMALSPTEVGLPIIKALGKKTTVFPGRLTKLLMFSLMTAPRYLKVKIMGNIMGTMTKHQKNLT